MKLIRYGVIVMLLLFSAGHSFAQKFTVGVYQNPPLIAMDEEGKPYGFFIDILEYIADEEGWELKYVVYNFDEGMEALKSGEIDILPDIGHSESREQFISFNNATLLTNWAEVYVNEDEDYTYDDIMDLHGTKIGAQESDFFLYNPKTGLLSLFAELGIEASIVHLSSYDEVLGQLSDEEIQIGLVSKVYADFNAEEFDVIKTPIAVAHVSLRYAFSKDSVIASVIPIVDRHIVAMLNDHNSIYYDAEKKFLNPSTDSFIPNWLWKVLLALAVGVVALGSVNIVLQAQVKRKTAELEKANRELLRSERQARLAAVTIEASKDIGFWFKPRQPFIQVNQAAIDLLGYSKKELLNMVPRTLLASEEDKKSIDGFGHKGWDGHLRLESKFRTKQGNIMIVELSLDRISFEGEEYICGFARDISKRVESEAALIKSEERLQLALQAANEGLWDLDFSTGLISFDDRFVESLGYQQNELTPLRDTWRNLMHPDDVGLVDEQFAKSLQDENNLFSIEFRLKNNDGIYVWFLFHGKITQFNEAGEPTFATGTIVNINDLKITLQENEQLLFNLQERNKELRCLYKVSQLIADQSNTIEDVVRGTINVVRNSMQHPDFTHVRISLDSGLFNSDEFKESEWKMSSDIITAEGKLGELMIYLDARAVTTEEDPFSEEEHKLVDALGKQLGNMIDAKNAEHKVVASILETEDRERKRISKEIHDSLGQTLSAISLNMDMVSKQSDSLGTKAKEKFTKTVDLLHLAIAESRSISHNLLPVTLDDFGYVVAVENMLESIGDSANIQFTFYSNLGDSRLSENIELSLFRITQEAVNNIIKHASATTVTIQLMHYDDVAILTIEDNGKGFDAKSVDENRKFGLNSMRNRAMSVHGTFTLDSQIDKGVIITVHVPLKVNADENTVG